MDDRKIDVWTLHKTREILVTDLPGVPADVLYVSEGTLGGTVFDADNWYVAGSWDAACTHAQDLARRLGYRVVYETLGA